MKRRILLLPFYFLLVIFAHAQSASKFDLGAGVGIDYGGFGARLTYLPTERVGVFGSLGYNLVGLGYNLGAQWRFHIESRTMLYLTAMYGYNAAVKVKGYTNDGRYIYYGPSIGAGFGWKLSKKKSTSLHLEMIVPFRSQALKDAVNDFNMLGRSSMPGYYSVGQPASVLFSLGIHYRLSPQTK